MRDGIARAGYALPAPAYQIAFSVRNSTGV
jgi:hypothetical protein